MKRSLTRRLINRPLHLLARFIPGATSVRVFIHRLRGVKIIGSVFIGDDVYLENEYPEQIEIHDGAEIALRTVIMAHFLGPGKVIIGANAYIGPNCVITAPGGKTLTIGEASVVGAGSVVTGDVQSFTMVSGVPAKPIATVTVPATKVKTYDDFIFGLKPIRKNRVSQTSSIAPVREASKFE